MRQAGCYIIFTAKFTVKTGSLRDWSLVNSNFDLNKLLEIQGPMGHLFFCNLYKYPTFISCVKCK